MSVQFTDSTKDFADITAAQLQQGNAQWFANSDALGNRYPVGAAAPTGERTYLWTTDFVGGRFKKGAKAEQAWWFYERATRTLSLGTNGEAVEVEDNYLELPWLTTLRNISYNSSSSFDTTQVDYYKKTGSDETMTVDDYLELIEGKSDVEIAELSYEPVLKTSAQSLSCVRYIKSFGHLVLPADASYWFSSAPYGGATNALTDAQRTVGNWAYVEDGVNRASPGSFSTNDVNAWYIGDRSRTYKLVT